VIRVDPDIPKLIPFESANRTVPSVVAVCVPAARTFPPSPTPPPAGTEIISSPPEYPTDAIPAPRMLIEAWSKLELELSPVVLLLAKKVSTPPVAPEIINDPFDKPTLTLPAPTNVKERASTVELELCPIVWLPA
jgi:hypothetical protein